MNSFVMKRRPDNTSSPSPNLLYEKPDSCCLQLSADSFPRTLQKKPGKQIILILTSQNMEHSDQCHHLCLLLSPIIFSVSFTTNSSSSRLLRLDFLLEMQPIVIVITDINHEPITYQQLYNQDIAVNREISRFCQNSDSILRSYKEAIETDTYIIFIKHNTHPRQLRLMCKLISTKTEEM